MSSVPEGYPKFKNKEKVERKTIIENTQKQARGRCYASWIAPQIKCSNIRDTHELFTRGRSGGTSQYDETQCVSICRKCHTVVDLEVWASEILGLYGEQGKLKHIPISEEDYSKAIELFTKAKSRIKIP